LFDNDLLLVILDSYWDCCWLVGCFLGLMKLFYIFLLDWLLVIVF